MLEHELLGNLTLSAIPYHNPIIMGAAVFMGIGILLILAIITYTKSWAWLWNEWITSVDHKKIGIMYIILAAVMLLRGFTDAIMMRLQQAIAYGPHLGYLPPEHFDQIFTAHGTIMIFFMAMAFIFGLVNYLIPLQIGARDVAYPYLNNLSFWLTAAGAILINISLVIGEFAKTGWLAYPPLSELMYSPGVGVDYYLWSLTLSGIGTLLGGINILVTIIKMRCPGMTLMKMPIFTWATLCAMILVVIAFPILNITLGMLFFDRFFGTHFFTSAFGGNAMLYINLLWTWGHPEVYILILPAFGIYSEIISTFSRKPIFGYVSMVWATFAITFLAFTVWLHHFFTMGAGADVNSFFGIATMIISIPTGVKIFNWLATMYGGKITFTSPMLWCIGFLITFTFGGMTGVLMAVPGVDFQLHNSLFLVAHFHNTIIGGVVFGIFAGLTFWFPKMFGFKLNEQLGKLAFWFWFIGFYVAFVPLYILGLMGMTRRLDDPVSLVWHPYLEIAAFGALLILCGITTQIIQLVVSIKQRHQNLDTTGDPWDARTLEWSIPSPAPFYNFVTIPTVNSRDAFWHMKQDKQLFSKKTATNMQSFHLPTNTSAGFLIAVFSGLFSFAMIWQIHWLMLAGAVLAVGVIILRLFNFNTEYDLDPNELVLE